MKISIITLFPSILKPYLDASILGRAQKKGLVEFELIDLREFGEGVHKTVDDKPYGGGVGMVLKADVLAKGWKLCVGDRISDIGYRKAEDKDQQNDIRQATNDKRLTLNDKPYTILTSASGKTFNQKKAQALSKLNQLIIVCGHYEGVDQRFIKGYVDEEISIGDYILTGGEVPALVIADSVVRLLKGVLEKEEAVREESFSEGLLEYPQYTRPPEFGGMSVPEVLLSGDHKKIAEWRKDQAVLKTKKMRPDLLNN